MRLETLRHTYLRRVIAPLLGAIGLDASDRLARWLGRGVSEWNLPVRRLAEARVLAAFDGHPDRQPRRLVAAMHEHFGRFLIEAIYARRLLRESTWRRFVAISEESQWRTLAASGKGCVLATAYYGNPAIAAYALGQIFQPIHVIADRFAEPILRDWQREASSFPQVRWIDPHQAGRVVPELLKSGRSILMVCEGERGRGPAVETEFLGRTLRCRPTLGRLARWFDASIGVFTCRRTNRPFSFELGLHAVLRGTSEESDELLVRETLHHLERAIHEAPEQYLWSLPSTGPTTISPPIPTRSALRPNPIRTLADAAALGGRSADPRW